MKKCGRNHVAASKNTVRFGFTAHFGNFTK